jgi:alkanesulfonate monooxygenase SsuD/methylene tetrahydromethanopterin reductase-like flavin-dependent oxidoreductase (luciferase family)
LKLKNTKKKDNIKFGCYIYQDDLGFKDILHIALECERLGYDSIWLKDNYIPWLYDYLVSQSTNNTTTNMTGSNRQYRRQEYHQNQVQQQQYQKLIGNKSMLECWTVLSSLAVLTTKIKLGAILVNLYRNPAIVAKMASTLDNISNGRLELGLSAGWYQKEAESYGVTFPTGYIRVEMLKESIILIRKLLDPNNIAKISFKGRYYNISNSECNPKPIQKPHLRLWIGGGGKKTLNIATKYADAWIYGLCSFDEYLKKVSFLKQNRENHDYDNNRIRCNKSSGEITTGWHGILLLGKDKEELKKRRIRVLDRKTKLKDSNFIISGTPNRILNEINKYLNIGVTYFIIYFPDLPDKMSLRLFAEHIISHIRNT